MNFNIILFCFIAVVSFGSCAQPDPSAGTAPTARMPVLSADSLRTLYRHYAQAYPSELPAQRRPAAGAVLYPVDEAPSDTAFFVFRGQLMDAVQERNAFDLLKMTDANVQAGQAGSAGIAAFVSAWGLDKPGAVDSSGLWRLLSELLVLGGGFEQGGGVFEAPYVGALWPEGFDASEHVAVTGTGVRVRSAPDAQAGVVASVSHQVLKLLGQSETQSTIGGHTHPWYQVQLGDGREGYIFGQFVRSPVAGRATFRRQADGRWALVALR